MKTSQLIIGSLMLITALGQVACKAKVTAQQDPQDIVSPSGFDTKAANGTWKTGCYVDKTGFASDSTLELTDGAFKTTFKFFNGSTCAEASLMQTLSEQGTFVVMRESSKEAGSWEVDLQIPQQQNGVTVIQHDLVRLENGNLYLGDVSAPLNGEYPSKVDKDKVFKK